MRVRCGYTSCKNNKAKGDGYFCSLKEIHIYSYWSSNEREKGEQMKCDKYAENITPKFRGKCKTKWLKRRHYGVNS